ncbi:MAG: head decoration protein [Bryobacteraceae bacterium]|nr:head decoration protein [Bryobacteraceae bacterium]
MPVLNQPNRLGDWLKWEEDNLFSRDEAVLGAGNLLTGAIVGRKAPAVTVTPGASNTGNGVMGTVTLGPAALPGNYVLTCKTKQANAGVLTVADPRGLPLPDLTVAVAYTGDHINMTLADGATDFEVGDAFTIGVATSNEVGEFNPAASDGLQFAAGVLAFDTDATGGATAAVVIARQAIVQRNALVWKSGVTAPQKAVALAQLNTLGILAREGA